MYIASEKGHADVVRLLIEAGAAVDKAADNGDTPMIIASVMGHVEVTRLLEAASAKARS